MNGTLNLNGIDRVNNAFGYTWQNCVACCENCNRSKGTRTVADFMKWALNIARKIKKYDA